MSSGYVLDFSNRTLREFVLDINNKDIYDDSYSFNGDSKANRLRAFWQKESNYLVAKQIIALIGYTEDMMIRREEALEPEKQTLLEECHKIIERIQQNGVDEGIDAILQPDLNDKDFSMLAESIRDCIEKNEPETALDRLHTYVFKYIRSLCNKHGITYDNK
jgi:hypothetical protein